MKTKLFALLAVLSASATSLQAVDFTVINTNPTGPGSLAQAINDANALPGPDRIVFNIPGSGIRKIDVSFNYLPKITDAVTIDGYTQPGSAPNTLARGSNAIVLIQIDGANVNGNANGQPQPIGLWVAAPDCAIRGLMITRFRPFTLNVHCCAFGSGYGILAADRTIIEGNFIGTDGSASTDLGNGGAGIVISGADWRIGGTTPAARNMIGGNHFTDPPAAGILVHSSTHGSILGNHIGRYKPVTGSSGAGTEGARNDIGIAMYGTFTETAIGGTTPGSGNVISGNGAGIATAYAQSGSGFGLTVADGVTIQGNLIGAEPGAASVGGNEGTGINLYGSNHVVGGSAAAASNFIGSNGSGIVVTDYNPSVNSPGSVIIGNDIIGNSFGGVSVFSADPDNRIGGLNPGEGNRINGNGTGIIVSGQYCSIFGNEIRANAVAGISVQGADNKIGGLIAGAANHLDANGIVVSGSSSKRNPILSNIFENSGAAYSIDLGNDGLTSNDLGDGDTGPNELQNFPIVVASPGMPGGTLIKGELNSAPSSNFTVQVFGNLQAEAEPRLLATQTVTTDANGVARFELIYPAIVEANSVTATATDALGNTSEMMPSNGPLQLANLSSRASVGTGENIMIGGFIVRSTGQKKIAVRALGPSLGVTGRLADPSLEIYDSGGTLLAKNDDWRAGQQQELMNSGLAPSNDLESALIISLPQGNYTAQVRGAHGETGTAVVEVYDLGAWSADPGRLVNLSTRARVGLNDDALIGGFIVRGDARSRVIVRAIGPDLGAAGVNAALQDPTLELRNQNGDIIAANDNWREGSQEQEIASTGIPPGDNRDAAIVHSFFPGSFTAVVRGKDNSTGLALVELYDLN
ncbi:MAG TPA: right-handed parallel beta-helix repeat-containing protein [Chthoniobacterales bacterium]|nr:right-handed parallel beta-helix repeat-containing protein [Chthoniobacterales bacterium]